VGRGSKNSFFITYLSNDEITTQILDENLTLETLNLESSKAIKLYVKFKFLQVPLISRTNTDQNLRMKII
jgi:hypothetical protein